MNRKTTVIANFNCTFGKDNKPMMEYFDSVIYPALINYSIEDIKDENLFFKNVEIIKCKDDRYVLSGILVKKTQLEIKTVYDEKNGLTFTNKYYDSAPISLFSIFLDNHRMIYTTNQKGSPTIRAFGVTVKKVIKDYIKNINLKLEKDEKIPFPQIDVVSIPSSESIKNQLENVEKIRKLTFKMFSPNGDIEMSNIFKAMIQQLNCVGSKRGSLVYNSPSNFKNVIETIDETSGLVEANLDVKFKNGGIGKIEHDKLTEKFQMEFEDDITNAEVQAIAINTYSENPNIALVSEENKKIFNDNKPKLINFLEYKKR
ncbi:MAG: hypothetical protein RR851_07925 [Clostridium sp.]